MNLSKIIGLKVVAIKGQKDDYNRVEPKYILFDDKETYIELEEQDKWDYHDCSPCAREIEVYQNREKYSIIVYKYADANDDLWVIK